MLIVESDENEEIEVMEEVTDLAEADDSVPPQLSFHALNGTYSFQTMRIKPRAGTRTLFFLINLGSV